MQFKVLKETTFICYRMIQPEEKQMPHIYCDMKAIVKFLIARNWNQSEAIDMW
jgi:hypothetical protein